MLRVTVETEVALLEIVIKFGSSGRNISLKKARKRTVGRLCQTSVNFNLEGKDGRAVETHLVEKF